MRESSLRKTRTKPPWYCGGGCCGGCCEALLRFFVVEGYLWDWLVAAGIIVVNLLVPVYTIEPLDRYYLTNDPTLSYPYHSNSVPTSALYILTFALPAVVFAVVAALQRSLVDWHHGVLSIAEGFALTSGFKRWINLVGRYRPNWLTVLAQGNPDHIDDSRLSYPSGHSAYMFFSGAILTWYLVGKLALMARPSQLLFLKTALALAPLVLAAFVAVSRIADYKHDPSDVNAGCFIGFTCGSLCYFLNYHSPFDKHCHKPKRRRVPTPEAQTATYVVIAAPSDGA